MGTEATLARRIKYVFQLESKKMLVVVNKQPSSTLPGIEAG